jgi:hypothetical protein
MASGGDQWIVYKVMIGLVKHETSVFQLHLAAVAAAEVHFALVAATVDEMCHRCFAQ